MRKLLSLNVLAAATFLFSPLNIVSGQDHSSQEQHDQEQHEESHEQGGEHSTEEEFNPTEVIMEHIKDSHGFHVWGEGHDAVSVPLPVILWTENGLVTFSSSKFHHDTEGHHVAEANGMEFVNYHEDIYRVDPTGGHLKKNEEDEVVSPQPVDFSITKNVFTLFIAAIIVFLIFGATARKYKKQSVPTGISKFMEPLVLFVRDEIAEPNIGPKYYKYMPYLLTVFFFIWVINLIGLVPFFPFSANLSGNISFTLTMAVMALLVVSFSGTKDYYEHIFFPKPWGVWPILMPIEVLSNMVIKFFALMVRLFANITAGHIVLLSLISLIFIFKSVWMSAVSVPFALFISVLELLVAALQAFIFTLLTSLFIGQALERKAH